MDFEAAIDDLYATLDDPASFDDALRALQAPLGASVLHILVIDSTTLAPVGGLCPSTPEGHELYLSRFADIDPRMGYAYNDSFEAFDINAVFKEPKHCRSPVYHEFLSEFDAQSGTSVIKRLGRSNTLILSSFRPASHGSFERELLTRFERVSRNIVRIMNLRTIHSIGLNGSDITAGTLFIDRAGRVLDLTRDAERELQRPDSAMRLSRGRFWLSERESDRALRRAIDAVLAGRTKVSDDIVARDPSGRIRYIVTVQKAVGISAMDMILCRPEAMIRFRKVDAPLRVSERLVGEMFDLTPSEASTASLLCDGNSPQAIARDRNVAVSTVRWTIRNLFGKVGASSQVELVAKIMSVPGVLG